MNEMQIIEHEGRPVAVTVDGVAILAGALRGRARRHVQAKALYALQVAAGERRGPYRDDDAEQFARSVRPERRGPSPRRLCGRRPA
jgi:hypothetical protein